MSYVPAVCEPFQAPAVLAGWICCECGHFNGKKKPACYFCKHACCAVGELPPLIRDKKKEAKIRHNLSVGESVRKWTPQEKERRAGQPRYLTQKQMAAMAFARKPRKAAAAP